MTTVATLGASLGLDTSAFHKGLNSAIDEAKACGSRIGGFLSNAASFAVGGVLVKGFDILTGSVGGLVGEMISGNGEFERYNSQFTTLLGSASAAKDRMDDLA